MAAVTKKETILKKEPPKTFWEKLSSRWGNLALIGTMLCGGFWAGTKYQESASDLKLLDAKISFEEAKDEIEMEKRKMENENFKLQIKITELQSIINIHETKGR